MMKYILLLVGFLLLIKGADFFVSGASGIAKRLKIPTLIIGLTIVAFGTSAPELAVSVTSALQGQNNLSVGNVVGSNMFNLLVVLGVAALIAPLKVNRSMVKKDYMFAILASIALPILMFDIPLKNGGENLISRSDGIILLLFFAIFMYYLLYSALRFKSVAPEENDEPATPMPRNLLLSAIGLAGIVAGGKLVVDSASSIALQFGMSEALVGLTIVSIGTSLPELVTSIVAARRGENDIAVGNAVGSNIFNAFMILGLSATISPMQIDSAVAIDSLILLVVTAIGFLFVYSKNRLDRKEGGAMVLMYAAYLTYIIIRN